MPNHIDHSLRHNFAIWVLGRNPGFWKPQRYMYRCVRCKWTFVINDGKSGVIRAVANDNGTSITPEEARARLATFAEGPCPGLKEITRPPIAKTQTRQRIINIIEERTRRRAN